MAEAIRIGELVVCSSRAFREQAGLGTDVGMYLVDRRRDGMVYFPWPDRSAWIPKDCLRAVEADDTRVAAPPAWLVEVHQAMRLLAGIDLALERNEDGGFEARIGCGGLDAARLAEIQALLGEKAGAMAIRPGSMSRVLVVFPTGPVDRKPPRT